MTTAVADQYGRFETLNYWQRERLPELGVSPSARLVWFVLWGRANKDGEVRISYEQIAYETGWSRRHCMDCVKELITNEVIKIHRRGNSAKKANTYALQVVPRKKR